MQTQHIEPAVRQLIRAVELTPERATAHTNLGVALEQKGDLASALRETTLAVSLAPERATPWVNLTQLSLRLHNPNLARSILREAERRQIHDPRSAHRRIVALTHALARADAEPAAPRWAGWSLERDRIVDDHVGAFESSEMETRCRLAQASPRFPLRDTGGPTQVDRRDFATAGDPQAEGQLTVRRFVARGQDQATPNLWKNSIERLLDFRSAQLLFTAARADVEILGVVLAQIVP